MLNGMPEAKTGRIMRPPAGLPEMGAR